MKPDFIIGRTDLDGVAIFLRVASRRSFTAAAADLGISPSAVSQAVRALETRLGVALLTRTTRDVTPTEAGERFLAQAVPAATLLQEAFAAARQLGGEPSGLLRLNVPRVVVDWLLAPILDRFHARYPAVQVEIHVDDRLSNIVADGFDAGIRLGEYLEADMTAVRLTEPFPAMVVASPAYLEARGRPERPEDLRRHACINFRQSARGTLYRWEFEEDGREFDIAVTGPVITNDAGIYVDAALKGLGLAYSLGPIVAPLVAAGRLEAVLQRFCPETPGMFLYFPGRAQALPKLRAFIETVREVARGDIA
jgi:DNA-binding transcriptional LysR family regulator